MAKPHGTSIRLFLADGNPRGLWIVEKSNWTGVGIVWPRSIHAEARNRPELTRAGVYVLLGMSDSSGQTRAYIGEADVLRKRLDQHHAQKDFWTRVVAFTTKDGSLNKAHGRYLEGRLLQLASQADRVELENGNAATLPALTEAEAADIESFLDEMLILFPVLDVRAFEELDEASGGRTYALTGPGAHASGAETADGFTVRKGSLGRTATVASAPEWLTALREGLVVQGVLAVTAEGLLLTKDHEFASPTAAAATFLGRNANGRTEWRDESGLTLKAIQTGLVADGA